MKPYVAVLLALGMAGCAHRGPLLRQPVELQSDALVTVTGKPPLQMRRGQKIMVGLEPVLVESPGRVSVLLILMPYDRPGVNKLDLKPGTMDPPPARYSQQAQAVPTAPATGTEAARVPPVAAPKAAPAAPAAKPTPAVQAVPGWEVE